MATITIRKELQDFLEKEGVLEAFIENVKRNRKGIKLLIECKISGLNTAFVWSEPKKSWLRSWEIRYSIKRAIADF